MPEPRSRRRTDDSTPRKGRVSDERWRKILGAAASIFAMKGYEATTIRDLAEAVGMLSGSLYYYIDTKEDLLFALIDDFHRMGSEEIVQVEAEHVGDDPVTILRAVIVRHVTINAVNGPRTAVFHNEFRHLDVARKSEIVEARRAHEARVEEFITKAQAAGQVRSELNPRLTALSILSMLNSTHHWYHVGRGATPEELGEAQADLLLNGLATTPPIGDGAKSRAAKRTAKKT